MRLGIWTNLVKSLRSDRRAAKAYSEFESRYPHQNLDGDNDNAIEPVGVVATVENNGDVTECLGSTSAIVGSLC